VQERNRSERDTYKLEGSLRFVKSDAWDAAELGLAVKDVSEGPSEDAESIFVGINGQRGLLAQVIGANVVETHNVIGVAVSEEDGVKAIYTSAQALLPEVGSRVNDDVLAIAGEEQRWAEPVVVRITRTADRAVASK